MPIQIQLKDEHIPYLKEVYGMKLKGIKDKIAVLEQEQREIEELLRELMRGAAGAAKEQPQQSQATLDMQSPFFINSPVNGYNPYGTILERITYILKENGGEMTTRQIIDRMLELQPTLNAVKEKISKNISTILSIHKGKKFERKTLGTDYVFSLK